MLGKKQREKNSRFIEVYNNIHLYKSKIEIDNLIDYTISEIKSVIGNKTWGLAWSGGKDSVVVEFLCKQIGSFPSCMGMTKDLEYPEFLRYVTNVMPEDLKVYTSIHDLKWLSNNLDWLFPRNSNQAGKWFKAIQHNAQNNFYKDKSLDLLITGRRLKDSNFVGENGIYKNKATGVVRYSPIYKWSHEDVIALMKYYNLPKAPFYNWRNGWIVGSGCWPARQWTGSIEKGWRDIYEIDKSIVMKARNYIKSADDYVRSLGL